MKALSVILIIFSLAKLLVAGSQEKKELATDLFYQLQNNLESFQKKALFVLLLDGIIGLICGATILLTI